MITYLPIAVLALAAQSEPPPAPPPPPAAVPDAPGYVSRCEMATLSKRSFSATVTVAAKGGKRRATIVSDAPDLLPSGTFTTAGVMKWSWRVPGRTYDEDVWLKHSGHDVTTSWSNRSGEGNLRVLPRGAKESDPRAAYGKCRMTWGVA